MAYMQRRLGRTPPLQAPARRRFGPLDCIEFKPVASSGAADVSAVVLFHGYGADAADLAPLAPELAGEKPLRWLFPDAPLTLPFGGRAWFPVDMEAFERAQAEGRHRDLSAGEPEGFAAAREVALEFLSALEVPWSRLILGGFSQGAMLATDLALRAPESPSGLVVLSGNLVNAKEWGALAPARKGLKFYQSHGTADPILGYESAARLAALLKGAGLTGDLLTFEGGHAIPREAMDALAVFLA